VFLATGKNKLKELHSVALSCTFRNWNCKKVFM